jgi:hypothetical protein
MRSSTVASEVLMALSGCSALKELHISVDAGLCLEHSLALRDALAALTQLTCLRVQSSEYYPGALLMGLAAFSGRVQHLDFSQIGEMVTAATLQQLVAAPSRSSNVDGGGAAGGESGGGGVGHFSSLTSLVLDGAWLGNSAAEPAAGGDSKQLTGHEVNLPHNEADGDGVSDASSDEGHNEGGEHYQRRWRYEASDVAGLEHDWPPKREALARCQLSLINKQDAESYGYKLSSSHQHVCGGGSKESVPLFQCRCQTGTFRSGKFRAVGLQGLAQAAPLLRHLQMDSSHAHNITALSALQGLTYLSAAGNAFTDKQAVSVLKQLRHLEHVDFRGSLWSRGQARELWACVLQLRGLTYLDLSIYDLTDCASSFSTGRSHPAATAGEGSAAVDGYGVAVTDVGVAPVNDCSDHEATAGQAVGAGAAAFLSVDEMQEDGKVMSSDGIDPDAAAGGAATAGGGSSSGTDLAAAFAPASDSAADRTGLKQTQSLQPCTSPLQVLILEGCNLDAAALAFYITKSLTQLQVLCLGWNYISSNGLAGPLSAVNSTLQRLSLRCMEPQLDVGGVAIAATSTPGLTAVDLAGNACGDAGVSVLASQVFWPKLRYLDIAANGVSPAAKKRLVEARRVGAPCGVVLRVPFEFISEYGLDFDAAVGVLSGKRRGFLKSHKGLSLKVIPVENGCEPGVDCIGGGSAANDNVSGGEGEAHVQRPGAAARYGSWCMIPTGKMSVKSLLPSWVDDRPSGYNSY